MKILFNCLTMEKGGAERVISLLANEFSRENDVSILTLKKSEDAYELNSKVKRIRVDSTNYKNDGKIKNIKRKLSFVRLSKHKKLLISESPDIIISFLPEPSLRLMLLSRISSKIRKIPKIISIRNDPEKEFGNGVLKRIMKSLYKDVDGMVYQTEDAKKYFEGIVKTKHQIIIPNPIDPSVIVKPKADAQRKNIIISVGRLEPQKNQEMLIKAFANSLKESEHNFSLKICGDGSLREYLQDLVDRLGVSDRVTLAGQVDTISRELNESKIFVLSSRYEGMPNALIEAMAMGLPCIATDCPCGGPRSLITNNENGLLVKNNDIIALSGAIVKLINGKRLREKLSSNAVKIRDSNALSTIASEWLGLMMKVKEQK